jgi:IS5 family transposase
MFLKYRYRLGYESLCAEVADSVRWRFFCRLPLDGPVPHPTTLVKITGRCGATVVDELNRLLLVKAAGDKVLRVGRVRADTTVVEANVAYPVDSGLLAKGIRRLARLGRRLADAGTATKATVKDRSRAAGSKAREVINTLRRRGDEARGDLARLNTEMVHLAERTVREAVRVAGQARHQGKQLTRRAQRLVEDLETLAGRVAKVAAQTRQRVVDGETPEGASRIVSLHDPDARPIRKGRLGRPVEFGYKAQVVDNDQGIILDWTVQSGNPPDAPMLAPAIERIKNVTGQIPTKVTADRGYGEAGVENDLKAAGVRTVHIPRKGRPGAARRKTENGRGFQESVRWRTGSEGRINHIKRSYGCRRTLSDGLDGARTWTGHGIFAHNLTKIAALTQ